MAKEADNDTMSIQNTVIEQVQNALNADKEFEEPQEEEVFEKEFPINYGTHNVESVTSVLQENTVVNSAIIENKISNET